MLTVRAKPEIADKPSEGVRGVLNSISGSELRRWVERLAVPRHYVMEPDENEYAGLWIAGLLQSWGYEVELQGPWRNVVATRWCT